MILFFDFLLIFPHKKKNNTTTPSTQTAQQRILFCSDEIEMRRFEKNVETPPRKIQKKTKKLFCGNEIVKEETNAEQQCRDHQGNVL